MKVTIAVLVLCCAAAATVAWERPAFCKAECPEYSVIEDHSDYGCGYEIREYPASKWVKTDILEGHDADSIQLEEKKASNLLDEYMAGSNDAGKVMPMTTPVLYTEHFAISSLSSFKMKIAYDMAIFVGVNVAANVPAPTDPKVTVVEVPTRRFYVGSFGTSCMCTTYTTALENMIDVIGDKSAINEAYTIKADYMQISDPMSDPMSDPFSDPYSDPYSDPPSDYSEVWLPLAAQ